MPRKLPRYCVEDVDRYGNVRIYLRRKGQKKLRLEGVPWTQPFMDAYHAAMDGAQPAAVAKITPHSWRWLCHQYFASPAFKALDAKETQPRRRAALEATFIEPTKPGADLQFGDVAVAKLSTASIRILRDRKAAESRDGANARLKAIRGVFKWATSPEVELCDHNPSRDVPPLQITTDGHHAWTLPEVQQFIKRHPIGSKAYLALCILLFAGGRRSDAVLLGRQHIQNGWLRYTHHKGRNSKPMTIEVPALPALRAAIDAHPSQHLTFLVTSYNKPFTSNGFGNWVKDRCVEAGLAHCSAHGLRKAGATLAAENGATDRQLMAMFGWRTPAMAQVYTKMAERKRLALAAMHLIDLHQADVPLDLSLTYASEVVEGELVAVVG